MAVISSCSRSSAESPKIEDLTAEQAALIAEQLPWPKIPEIKSNPTGPVDITVYISENCLMCDSWQKNWPSDVPAAWVIEGSCTKKDGNCKNTPRIEFNDGTVITGWPDEQWLKAKTGRPFVEPEPSERPIINI